MVLRQRNTIYTQQVRKHVMTFSMMKSSRSAVSRTRSAMMVLAAVTVMAPLPALRAAGPQVPQDSIRIDRIKIKLIHAAEVSVREAGAIDSVSVQEGDRVKAGRILAILDNDQHVLNVSSAELNLQVAELRAEDDSALESAKAQLAEARSGRQLTEVSLEIAEKESSEDLLVQIASAETRLRQLELERAQGARKSFKGSISESQIDRLKTSVEKGNLEIQQARKDHDVKGLKTKAEVAALQQKSDEVRRFEALVVQGKQEQLVADLTRRLRHNELRTAEIGLERRNVRAPFEGTIVEVNAQPGEWVEKGAPVLRIIDLKTLRAEGLLSADKASQKLVGRQAAIRVNGKVLTGKVTFVSPEINSVKPEVRVFVEFKNADETVLPGMNGSLEIAPVQR